MSTPRRCAAYPSGPMAGGSSTGRASLRGRAGFLSVAGCTGPAPSRADLARQTDCRAEADRQYDRQNRYLLSEQDQTGTPFSSHGLPGDTTSGLSDLYARDRAVDTCIRTGDPTPADPLPAGPAH